MTRLFILFLLLSNTVFSQYKFEKEYRISLSEVPNKSKTFIESFNFNKKVKWYAEESQSGKSFEAKTCYKKRRYSIEFDTTGTIIDAEVTVKFSKLDKEIQTKIRENFSNVFSKFSIVKTQIQFVGAASLIDKQIRALVKTNELNSSNYEIVVKGKKENRFLKYEFLFNSEGEMLQELQFSPENHDNLEF